MSQGFDDDNSDLLQNASNSGINHVFSSLLHSRSLFVSSGPCSQNSQPFNKLYKVRFFFFFFPFSCTIPNHLKIHPLISLLFSNPPKKNLFYWRYHNFPLYALVHNSLTLTPHHRSQHAHLSYAYFMRFFFAPAFSSIYTLYSKCVCTIEKQENSTSPNKRSHVITSQYIIPETKLH